MPDCLHMNFAANVVVARLVKEEGSLNAKEFVADVTIHCADCQHPFVFLGLPSGYSLDGPTVSVDGLEARLAVAPQGVMLPVAERSKVRGFTIGIVSQD